VFGLVSGTALFLVWVLPIGGRGFSCTGLNLIDRYVLREWLKTLVLVLGITLGLLLMQAMYDDFSGLLEKGASMVEVMVFFAVKIPGYLAIILPLTLLVSLLFALGQLHRNNETVAMRAAGLGVFRITRSIWMAGVLMCGLVWAVNASVVPWSIDEAQSILEHIDFRHQAQTTASDQVGLTRVVTFDNQRQGRMWFINRYSQFQQRAYGVSVSELDAKHREKSRIRAREARYAIDGKGWVFYDGRETWLDPETSEVTRTAAFDVKAMPHFTEDPDLMLVFDQKPVDLSFFKLRRIIDYFRVEENPKVTIYAVRYYGLLADTLSPLIVLAIAIPFAMAGVRVNPAVGVSKSIGLFLIYFVLLKFSDTLGTRGIVEPQMAALLPSIVMLGVGGFFFLRMR
jgi:lipopolysaccharide export system permease protein